jgi:hypothetical protein
VVSGNSSHQCLSLLTHEIDVARNSSAKIANRLWKGCFLRNIYSQSADVSNSIAPVDNGQKVLNPVTYVRVLRHFQTGA